MHDNQKPNFIVIFCDNMGYGDLACYGSQLHRTPHVDRMAQEGLRFTDFYSSSPVCTPSRASLLTGCYAQRLGMHVSDRGGCVLQPIAAKGLHPQETTIARLLKEHGYATACIGKWHLGDQPPFLPTRHGFDEYCGIPYSEDMIPARNPDWPPLPLMRNEQVIQAPADLRNITQRYTQEAIDFITQHQHEPFFLYLPHATPGSERVPQVGDSFRGRSTNGPYGDCIEELDWSTGEILDVLQSLGLDDTTLVVFTSDNGIPEGHGGSNAPLGGWAYSTSEGGMRMPCIMRWPGHIPAGQLCTELCTTMDLFPTLASLVGAEIPRPHVIDGKDIWSLIACQPDAVSPHRAFYYYFMDQLQAVRSGQWKLHLPLDDKRGLARGVRGHQPLKLIDLSQDKQESTDVSNAHPEVVRRLLVLAQQAREELGDEGTQGSGIRPAGTVAHPTPRRMPAHHRDQ